MNNSRCLIRKRDGAGFKASSCVAAIFVLLFDCPSNSQAVEPTTAHAKPYGLVKYKGNSKWSSKNSTTNSKSKSKSSLDSYEGFEIIQNSKHIGTNKILLCNHSVKFINPLMSICVQPGSNLLTLSNNQNRKYFRCDKDKFPHYLSMIGFGNHAAKELKYTPWKKLEETKIAGDKSNLYQRKLLHTAPNFERKEQVWASADIETPKSIGDVYALMSGRSDICEFGFPLKSQVILDSPESGFQVRIDFDTRTITPKTFSASDFEAPKDFVQVKEFSEFMLNDSETSSSTTLPSTAFPGKASSSSTKHHIEHPSLRDAFDAGNK